MPQTWQLDGPVWQGISAVERVPRLMARLLKSMGELLDTWMIRAQPENQKNHFSCSSLSSHNFRLRVLYKPHLLTHSVSSSYIFVFVHPSGRLKVPQV